MICLTPHLEHGFSVWAPATFWTLAILAAVPAHQAKHHKTPVHSTASGNQALMPHEPTFGIDCRIHLLPLLKLFFRCPQHSHMVTTHQRSVSAGHRQVWTPNVRRYHDLPALVLYFATSVPLEPPAAQPHGDHASEISISRSQAGLEPDSGIMFSVVCISSNPILNGLGFRALPCSLCAYRHCH